MPEVSAVLPVVDFGALPCEAAGWHGERRRVLGSCINLYYTVTSTHEHDDSLEYHTIFGCAMPK